MRLYCTLILSLYFLGGCQSSEPISSPNYDRLSAEDNIYWANEYQKAGNDIMSNDLRDKAKVDTHNAVAADCGYFDIFLEIALNSDFCTRK